MTAETRHCPRCYAPLRASESPEGLCPKCLLAVGMGEDAVIRTNTGAPVPAPPAIDELRPHFEGLDVLALVGRGGAGAVYRATQRDLGRQVALKVLLLDPNVDPTFGERFVREARAMASLAHPNIAAVHDAGRAGPFWYLVMEFVDGPNLRQLIQSRDLTASEALDVVRQICDALEYAHAEGVVHRDIKPENVLVDARGRVKLVDFGLAKLLGPELGGGATLTRSAQAMGTWHYMAPEQLRRPLEVDHRADIYSLGVVLYELLTGEVPQGRYAPVSERARADRRLDAIVDRALEQDPSRRYQHASGVREDVAAVQSGPGASGPEFAGPAAHRVKKESRREAVAAAPARKTKSSGTGWLGCLFAVVFVLFLMFAGGIFLFMAAPQQPDPHSSVENSVPLPRPATKAAAVIQGLYGNRDVSAAAARAWETYDALVEQHSSVHAFENPDGAWLQFEVAPFPEERARLIDRALRRSDISHSETTMASYRERLGREDVFPYGDRWHVVEVRRGPSGTINVTWNDKVLAEEAPIQGAYQPPMHHVMRAVHSEFDFDKRLAAAEGLPWTDLELGLGHAPSFVLRGIAAWYADHLVAEDQHTTRICDPATLTTVFLIDGFRDAYERSRMELRDAMTANLDPTEWADIERAVQWESLAVGGRADTTSVQVRFEDGMITMDVLRDGTVIESNERGERVPQRLARFVESAVEAVDASPPSLPQLDLGLVWPDGADGIGDDVQLRIASIVARYRRIEKRNTTHTPSARRAMGGSQTTGWRLALPPKPRAILSDWTIESFPDERAALERDLRETLARLDPAPDENAVARIVFATLPFGERRVALGRDDRGGLIALIATTTDDAAAELIWLGDDFDWRCRRFLGSTPPAFGHFGSSQPIAPLTQELVAAARDGVVPSDLELAIPSDGALLMLGAFPSALRRDPRTVAVAEQAWAELASLIADHALWSEWNDGERTWLQLDVVEFEEERRHWQESWATAFTDAFDAAAADSFTQSIEALSHELPGRVDRAELVRDDDGRDRITADAASHHRPVYEILAKVAADDSPQEAYPRPLVECAWPFAAVPPPARWTRDLSVLRGRYLEAEKDYVSTRHSVGRYGDIEIVIGPFQDVRAKLYDELTALRQGQIDRRANLVVADDVSAKAMPFGEGESRVHLRYIRGGAEIVAAEFAAGIERRVPLEFIQHLIDPDAPKTAELFCDPGELGLPADLPPAVRWQVADARRSFRELLLARGARVERDAPSFERPADAPRRLAEEGDVVRIPRLADDVAPIEARLRERLDEWNVEIVDEALLRRMLFPMISCPYDARVTSEDGKIQIDFDPHGPVADGTHELEVESITIEVRPGWRWDPYVELWER